MSNNNDTNTQILEPETTSEQQVQPEVEAAAEVPVTKTKKELKKERKELKKHKKEVRKEAKRHSAKATKAQKFFLTLLTLIVIVCMIVCCYSAITVTQNISNPASASTDAAADSDSEQTNTTPTSSTPAASDSNSSNTSTPDAESSSDAADNTDPEAAAAAGDLSTKESVVEYYKTAHAKVLAEAKSVTRTYDNVTNYKGVVEVGGNSTIAGIAKTLMDMFMKENTEAVPHSGDEIKTSFPPASAEGSSGLTADMISDYTCKEENGNYIITLTLNSTEENPDDGTIAKHLVDVVEDSQITDAAGSYVQMENFKNEYIGATVTATIEKDTGKITALETNTPSYMCFGKVTALSFITVENCKLGLLYEQKWTVEW